MKKQNENLPIIILAIILLLLISGIKSPTFSVLYNGQILEAELTNQTGECFTLGNDRCVRQEVNMLELLGSGLLICPESYYPTQIDCERAFGLIKKPKLDCYYVDGENDVCILEQFEDQCPSTYYDSLSTCEASLVDLGYSAKSLLKNNQTLIMIGIGAVALLFIGISFLRRR